MLLIVIRLSVLAMRRISPCAADCYQVISVSNEADLTRVLLNCYQVISVSNEVDLTLVLLIVIRLSVLAMRRI